jgi:hypothetical protein
MMPPKVARRGPGLATFGTRAPFPAHPTQSRPMRSDLPGFNYTLVDRTFFESLDRYAPDDYYRGPVERMLGEGWRVYPAGFWTQCFRHGATFRQQGWKIHLSAVVATANTLLERVVPVLAARGVPFKFVSDRQMHALSLSKIWPREGTGKFITIYPDSDEQFPELVTELDALTRDLRGPYILSDRPYQDSRTVFYRYGEHQGQSEVSASGFRRRVVQSPTGAMVEDSRTPYYQLPAWTSDPFGGKSVEDVKATRREVVLGGRYRVVGALKFNSSGGIYAAVDERTERKVVIREARPYVGEWAPGQDSISMLQKEARILERMGPTGLCPGYVDLFQQWEHWFLVQELIEAESLWGYAIGFFWGRRRRRTPRDTFERLRRTFLDIMDGMERFHQHGVVLRDMTRTNLLMGPDERPVFIDFEMAYELDRGDPMVHGFTAGFASRDQLAGRTPSPAEDYYALGALLLDMVTFMVPGLPLHRKGILEAYRTMRRDLELPDALDRVVDGLLEEDASLRWTPARVRAELEGVAPRQVPARRGTLSPAQVPDPFALIPRPAPAEALRREVEGTIPELVRFIEGIADLRRTDRLFPASPDVFLTNPVSLLYGSAGILSFLHAAGGEVDRRFVRWTVARAREQQLPPGMYVGRAGVALALAGLGREEAALSLVEGLAGDPLLEQAPGFYAGAAGAGVALLALGHRLGRPELTAQAAELGDRLLRTARRRDDDRLFWHGERRRVPLGLAHGQSGVALFLLYLHAATRDSRYLDAARKALAFDLSHGVRTSGELLWTPTTHATAGEPKSPHVEYGTAGVGTAVLRMYRLTGAPEYRRWAWDCARATCERYTNKIWYNYGLAGFGHFLLDVHRWTGDENCLNTAFYQAEALLPHRIRTDRGTAFPGSELARISCDFAMGSAGIGWFLLRLLDPSRPHPFLPDELLEASGSATAAAPSAEPAREPAPAAAPAPRRRRRALAATG